MEHERRRLLLEGLQLADTSVNLGCLLVAYSSATGVAPLAVVAERVRIWQLFAFVALALPWLLIQTGFGLYFSRRLSRRRSELLAVLGSTAVNAFLVAAGMAAFGDTSVALHVAGYFFAFSFLALSSLRMLLRTILASVRRHGRNLRNVVIVGLNKRSLAFTREILTRHELGYVLLGFADDWQAQPLELPKEFERVADLSEMAEYLKNNPVDEVAIFLPVNSFYSAIRTLVVICADTGIVTRIGGDLFDVGAGSVHLGVPLHPSFITVARRTIGGTSAFIKYMLDRIIALALILLFSPVLIAVAIAVKLTSPGPAIFQQWRVGMNKRLFRICKFRTMFEDAERRQAELEAFNEHSGPVFKIRKDPRITPLGTWLRRTSLDELPQLFNVLKGDMSLIGPRPLPVRDFNGFSASPHLRRFSVRPGISCLWQVSGRNDIDFEGWMKLDLQYIESWSLWLDFKIMAMTIPAVLKGRGAS